MWQLFERMKPVPLLLIRGALTDLLSADVAEKMVELHGNAKLVTVPRVGHAPGLDEAEAVSAIKTFLANVEVSA